MGITLDTYSHVVPNLQTEAAQGLERMQPVTEEIGGSNPPLVGDRAMRRILPQERGPASAAPYSQGWVPTPPVSPHMAHSAMG